MLFCTACQAGSPNLSTAGSEGSAMSYRNDEESFQEEITKKTDDILSRSSDQPANQLISAVYSEDWLFANISVFRRYNPLFSYQQYLETVDEIAPVECIRKTGEDSAYVIYRTELGWVYLFFKQQYDRWFFYNGAYVQKHLSVSDFSEVQALDSMDAIAAIDPSVDEWRKVEMNQDTDQYTTIHLTSDGVVVIEYQVDNGAPLVSRVTISDDYKWTDYRWEQQGVTYDYQILSQDIL